MIDPTVGICCLLLKKDKEMLLTRVRSLKRKSDVKADTSVLSKVKRKSSKCKKNKGQKKSQFTFKKSDTESQFNKTSQKITSTLAMPQQVRSSIRIKNISNKKSEVPTRSTKKTDQFSLKDEGNQSKVSRNLRSRSSISFIENSSKLKENNLLQKEFHQAFNELTTESQINKTSQMVCTSTPIIPRRMKSPTLTNISNKKEEQLEKSKVVIDQICQVSLVRLEDEDNQSKVSRNLRSRCSTSLIENSSKLKEKELPQRRSHSSNISVNNSRSTVPSKKGRKPLICKKNIMKVQHKQYLEESGIERDIFQRMSTLTSTPVIPSQRKTKTLESQNVPNHQVIKNTGTKKKCLTISDFPFVTPKKTATSSKKPHNKLKGQITKSTQKYATKENTGIKCPKKAHTLSEFPIDDLSLSKPVMNKRKVKSDGFKSASKNTLKRKRHVFNEFHKADEGYEDDIYESQSFECFKDIFEDTSFSDISSSMPTPKFGVLITPRILPKTPVFKDCISPMEYTITRKVAEECLYRKKKSISHKETPVPEKKKLEFNQVLEKIQMQEKVIENLMQESRRDDEDSCYLSD